jgi:hypothetical protein
MALSVPANAAGQKILIESFTGTWCGPCGSSGKPASNEVLATWPNDVFVTELHVGNDPFVIPVNQQIQGAFGITGVPSGLLNRNPFNSGGQTVWGIHPTSWKQVIPQMLTAAPVVEVKAFYGISGNTLSVTVEAEFLTAVSVPGGELRFNVYLNENNLPYSQAGITGTYNHMHVCRAILGGAFGTTGIIPNSVAKGQTYSYTYNFTLNSAWKVNDLEVFGVVNEYHTGDGNYVQILNACKATPGEPSSELTVTGTTISAKLMGTAYEKVFKLRNVAGEQTTFKIELDKSARTPGDWTAEVVLPSGMGKKVDAQAQTYEIVLNRDQQVDITVKLTPNSIGAGDASFIVSNKYDSKGQKSRGAITCVSSETKYMQVTDYAESADAAYSIKNNMTSSNLTNVVEITAEEFSAVGTMLGDLDILVWNSGEKGEISSSEAGNINTAINDGVNVFMLGGLMQQMGTNASSLLSNIGVSFAATCFQGLSTQGNVNLIGYNGDAISNGFDQACKLVLYLTPAFKSTRPTAVPFLRHKSVDSVVAIRSTVNDTRVILMGINPYIITSSTARNSLLTKCFDWLAGTGPSIECASTMNFTETEVGSTTEKTITIENKGKSPLVVSEIEIEYDFQINFKVKGNTNFTIPAGETYNMTIEFKPGYAVNYNTWMKIKSNAENAAEKNVALVGKGIAATAGAVAQLSKTSIQFAQTNVGENAVQSFDVTNTGNEALNVTNITVPGAYAGIFVIEPTSFSVAAGKKQAITVTFQPEEEGTFSTNMTIVSNAKNSPTQLSISASAIVGVDDFAVKSELMSLVVGPNPFELNSKIEFTLNGSVNRNVEINLVDANGRVIKSIDNKTFAPGVYNFDLNSNAIASGTYFIVAKTKDNSTQIPVVIVK